jgi:hypothetical protein
MSQRALISVVVLFCLKVTSVNAQVSTLDPSQTVNPATGQMGFSLPLGVVKGVSGHDFPINLNYQSGIRANQEASPAGLGFSYGAGEITRRVVFVPDDNVGGVENFSITQSRGIDVPNWHTDFKFICLFGSIFIGLVTGGGGAALGAIGFLASEAVGLAPTINSAMYVNSLDFTAGGTHIRQYDTRGEGRGFFNGGEATDLPDVYFISTPYLSGEFVWVGDPQTGHFVLKGSSAHNTVKIERTTINIPGSALTNRMAFKITLADGTRLIFNDMDAMPMFSITQSVKDLGHTGCHSGNCDKCGYYNLFLNRMNESMTSSWHLTAVLPPEYVDGNGDNDPLNSKECNTGAWIGVEYEPMEFTDHYMYTGKPQSNPYGVSATCFGDPNTYSFGGWASSAVSTQPVRLSFLKKVHTPNECAVFNYAEPYDRLDRYWISHVDETKLCEPRLAEIEFQNHRGEKKYGVEFVHDYSLKTRVYFDENGNRYQGGSLSLLSINKRVGSKSYKVSFDYALNPTMAPLDFFYAYIPGTVGETPWEQSCLKIADMELKDLWGYYYFNDTYYFQSDRHILKWNENGDADFSHPEAWSVSSVSFANGMKIKWEYELNRYLYANGIVAKRSSGVPVTKYGGGTRVKSVTVEDGMGKEYTRSYFYTKSRGVFVEDASNSSGYASAEPYPFNLVTDPRADDKCKGGLYTADKVAYSKVQVVDNYHEVDETHPFAAPNGYTVYEFTHAGDPSIEGYYPNLGTYGDVDCTWKRGLPVKTAHYDKNGKMVDSTYKGYTFTSHDTVDYSFADIETQSIKSREHKGFGSSNYGWVRLDSSISIHKGVRKKETYKYNDKNPSSKDYSEVIVPRSCMKYSSTSPTMTVELGQSHYKGCSRTAMIKGTGPNWNTGVVYVAQGTSNTGVYDHDLRLQAINNVGITSGRLDLDNAQWSNVKLLSGMEDDGPWLFTGMDAIAYNDAEKNDLLLQFVEVADHANKVKLIILQNARVEGVNIVCDDEIPLLVVFDDHGHIDGYPYFQTSSSSNPSYMDGQGATCSAVCNLDGGPIDIILYYADHGASYIFDSHNPCNFYILSDVDLHTRTSWRNESNGYTYNTITYDYSKSVKAHITVQDPSGNYPQIGHHACFLDLDNDGMQNDWVATDMYQENVTRETTINDVVIKNIAVNPAAKTFTIPPTDPTLGQTTHIVKPAAGNFSQAFPLSSKTNTFGLVTPGDLSLRIYPFHFPVGPTTLRTSLYGTYKVQADADLDGQPNEVWTTAPNNKCVVTKTIPAYWNYNEMGISSNAQPDNKHMLAPSCQKIVYAGPETTGSLLREYWLNISGSSVDDFRAMLYNRPDAVDELTTGGFFDCPTNFADNYGERIRGHITPPTTGSYTFWIASDDNSELWLSTDENPGNKSKIASITGDCWTNHNIWDTYPSQQSGPVNLIGGRRYYIEVLHKEGIGGDNLSVGWQGPEITGDAERPIPLSRFTPLPTPKNVVSSQVTTWSNSSGNWLPGSSYSWKTNMNSSGLPVAPLVDFNFDTPTASNTAWKFTGSMEKYDHISTPLEVKNAKGISSTTIYRNDVHLPIAAVANSKYDECAIYTCDYGIDNDNGWEKGSGCSMSVTRKHFGDSSVYVDKNYGPTKNITGFSTAKSYIFSAWVYPLDGNAITLSVEKRIGGVYSGNFGKDFTFTADEQNKWNLVKVPITPAQLTGMNPGSDYLRIHVSCNPGNNAQFYVDDIRFYPKNALVTTT